MEFALLNGRLSGVALVGTLFLPLAACDVLAQDVKIESEKKQDKKSEIPADTEIKTTKSGLKYSVLKAGTGTVTPATGDKVQVHYTGWLTNGKKFDSSRGGQPFSFSIGSGVIPGWSEGVALMKKGARYKFTIPAKLGYGARGRGTIPPNATLIFDVELLDIKAMPRFVKGQPEKQKTTKSGLVYESLKAGKGDNYKAGQVFKFDYAIFRADGRLLECTAQTGNLIAGTPDQMRLPFLKEAPMLMNVGSKYRFEVPADIGIKQIGKSVWTLELVKILEPLPVPKFEMSPADATKTTPSGLKYEVIKAGKGKSPTRADTVRVHYAGWLTDGKLFDSSYQRAEPAEFPLGRVIPGWTEGIALMKVGGIYRFTIPGDLAYGPRGSGKLIGPNATLVFYVELLGIK